MLTQFFKRFQSQYEADPAELARREAENVLQDLLVDCLNLAERLKCRLEELQAEDPRGFHFHLQGFGPRYESRDRDAALKLLIQDLQDWLRDL